MCQGPPFAFPRSQSHPFAPSPYGVSPSPPPFCCTAGLSICSLVRLILPLLLPICALQGTLFSFQQAVLGSQPTLLLPWEAQLSLMGDNGYSPEFLMGCTCEPRGRWARLQLGTDERVAPGGAAAHRWLAPELRLQL